MPFVKLHSLRQRDLAISYWWTTPRLDASLITSPNFDHCQSIENKYSIVSIKKKTLEREREGGGRGVIRSKWTRCSNHGNTSYLLRNLLHFIASGLGQTLYVHQHNALLIQMNFLFPYCKRSNYSLTAYISWKITFPLIYFLRTSYIF
jgi:hypothetical protein